MLLSADVRLVAPAATGFVIFPLVLFGNHETTHWHFIASSFFYLITILPTFISLITDDFNHALQFTSSALVFIACARSAIVHAGFAFDDLVKHFTEFLAEDVINDRVCRRAAVAEDLEHLDELIERVVRTALAAQRTNRVRHEERQVEYDEDEEEHA